MLVFTMLQAMQYPQMLEVFLQNGVVESNSPKNRKKLYQQLEKDHITWTTEIIGYTAGQKELCRWNGKTRKLGWSLSRIVKWIQEKRLLPDDLEKACERTTFKFEDIKEVFNENISNKDRYQIFIDKWGDPSGWPKWTPFDYCVLRKTIVRITKI